MKIIRVYINKKITNGFIELDQSQTHYIKNVMRSSIGDNFNIFNENDGEWIVELLESNKKISKVKTIKKIGFKDKPSDIWVLFAPVKKLRVDFIAQKITELGARLIWPVITDRTQYQSIKTSKILSNAIEAAEQWHSIHSVIFRLLSTRRHSKHQALVRKPRRCGLQYRPLACKVRKRVGQ